MSTDQIIATQARRIRIKPHRLGMGWHHIWEYDPPIEHHVRRPDGTTHCWREAGESSEGCIMWLTDCFVRERLSTSAREIFRQAYKADDDNEFEDEWLDTDALRGMWAPHTIVPKRWTASQVQKLFEDLEDVNYLSFLTRLIELIEERLPELAARLTDWCTPAHTPACPHTSAH